MDRLKELNLEPEVRGENSSGERLFQRCRILALFTAAILLGQPACGSASIVGGDNASVADYNDGWTSGDDGSSFGDAFGAWNLSNSGTAGFFIGDSTGLSSPGADINVSGKSFGMFGASGSSAVAARSLNGGGLSLGSSLSFDLAVNFRNGNKGVNILDGATEIFNFNTGSDDYVVSNATTGNGSIGSAYSSDTAFNVTLTQTSLAGGIWEIARSGGVTDFDTGTYSGLVSSFEFYVAGTDGGSPNDLFFNRLLVTPEPTTAVTFAISIAGLVFRRRRS